MVAGVSLNIRCEVIFNIRNPNFNINQQENSPNLSKEGSMVALVFKEGLESLDPDFTQQSHHTAPKLRPSRLGRITYKTRGISPGFQRCCI